MNKKLELEYEVQKHLTSEVFGECAFKVILHQLTVSS